MLEISYRLRLDYPLYVILSQYYDYEHIGTVHPETLGEYRVIEVRDDGRDILYEHLWPARRNRPRAISRVRHRFLPPLSMEFEFVEGKHRGTRVLTHLAPDGERATIIDETYFIPRLPNWRWLARCLKPLVMAPVNRIWKEDLDVGVCIDGWPGVPAAAKSGVQRLEATPDYPPLPKGLTSEDIPEGQARGFLLEGAPVAVIKSAKRLHTVADRCPHTGGPLSLGKVTADRRCIECPWHGAQFDLTTGDVVKGPAKSGVEVVRAEG